MSNTIIHFFDQEHGVYKRSDKAPALPNSDLPEVPSDATEEEPLLKSSPFQYENKLKSIYWRKENKVDKWIWDNYMAIEGHWESTYFLPEPYYKIDDNGYFLNEVIEGGCFDEAPDMPFDKPNSDFKIARWNKAKSIWEEASKPVTVLDDDGFVVSEEAELADVFFSDVDWVDLLPDKKLLKPKYDKATKTFIEAKDIEELREEKLEDLKNNKANALDELRELSTKLVMIKAYNGLIDDLSLDRSLKETTNTELLNKAYEEVKKWLDLDKKAALIKTSIIDATELYLLSKISTNQLEDNK